MKYAMTTISIFFFTLGIALDCLPIIALAPSVHTSIQLVHRILFYVKNLFSKSKIWVPIVFEISGLQNKIFFSKESFSFFRIESWCP